MLKTNQQNIISCHILKPSNFFIFFSWFHILSNIPSEIQNQMKMTRKLLCHEHPLRQVLPGRARSHSSLERKAHLPNRISYVIFPGIRHTLKGLCMWIVRNVYIVLHDCWWRDVWDVRVRVLWMSLFPSKYSANCLHFTLEENNTLSWTVHSINYRILISK